MKSAVLLPFWGLQAFEGIRTALLQQMLHRCHALPVWSYMRAPFAQTAKMPPLFLLALVLLVRSEMFIKLVDFLFPLMIGIACFLWQANNWVSEEQRSNIAPKNGKQR